MGRLIVFEETGEQKQPKLGDWYLRDEDILIAANNRLVIALPILRRLTDAEVDALVTAKPADDERGRFVRECAMRVFLNIESRCGAAGMAEGEWESRRDEFARTAIADAESLAARLFGEGRA